MAELRLADGRVARVDKAILPLVIGYSWHLYPRGICRWHRQNGCVKLVNLKRLITGAVGSGTLAKLRNGNPLDYRKRNLYVKPRAWQADVPDGFCACGCGTKIKAYRSCGTLKRFVSGHNGRKYSTPEESERVRKSKQKAWRKGHPKSVAKSKREFYRRTKLKAMAVLGNKCHICGIVYNGKNAPIFEFDHLNPAEKESGITRLISTARWKTLLKELKKCKLVCANCHNMRHGGQW